MTIVAQVIKNKSEQAIFTISPEATVLEAITIMAEKGIGALVVAEGEQVVGILSERDYTRKVTLMERSSYSTTVAEIMTAKVITVGLNNTVEECLQLMTALLHKDLKCKAPLIEPNLRRNLGKWST